MRNFLTRCILGFARLVTLPCPAWKRIDIRHRVRDSILTESIVVDAGGGRLLFGTGYGQKKTSSFLRQPEPDTVGWIEALPGDACLWDVGAHIGVYSLRAAMRLGIRVLAFEPSASSFAALNENIRLNGMSERVRAYGVALAATTHLDTLNMTDPAAGSSNNGFGAETNQFGDAIDIRFRQGAVGFSIDDFVTVFGAPPPTHVKIDVDGIEAEILRGGRTVLSGPAVRSMIVEIEGDLESAHNREIFALMAELDFVPRPKASPTMRNVIFDKAI